MGIARMIDHFQRGRSRSPAHRSTVHPVLVLSEAVLVLAGTADPRRETSEVTITSEACGTTTHPGGIGFEYEYGTDRQAERWPSPGTDD